MTLNKASYPWEPSFPLWNMEYYSYPLQLTEQPWVSNEIDVEAL